MVEKVLASVIPRKLIVGQNDVPLGELTKAGVTVIVDLNQSDDEREEAERLHMRYYENKNIRIPDNYQPIPIWMLHDVVKVLSDFIMKGECVYLHCTGGKGRSPTVAAAYLVSTGSSVVEAVCSVKEARPEAWKGRDARFADYLCKFAEEYRSQ